MAELVNSRVISGMEYLLIWFGLTGSCVGLYLPKEMGMFHSP
jgi:hypothetical protein